MADLACSRVLDESKIEDDDMVDIVFRLTDFADDNKQSMVQKNTTTTTSSTYQSTTTTVMNTKRQHSFDQTDPVRPKETHRSETQFQSREISGVKTVSIQKDSNVVYVSESHANRPRKKKTRSKSDLGLFKMFKPQEAKYGEIRSSGDGSEKPDPPVSHELAKLETVNPQKCFVHYDSLSVLSDFRAVPDTSSAVNNFSNLKSGAATVNIEECVETDADSLLLDTPKFINEFYDPNRFKGTCENSSTLKSCPKHRVVVFEGSNRVVNGPSNRDKILVGINLGDFTVDRRFLSFEHMDHGSNYYRRYFADHDHVNYFGVSEPQGPVAISVQREKSDIGTEQGETNYQYRIIIRSAQMPTLRGSILEEFLPSARGSNKVHLRDILECLAPHIKQENLKLAENKVAVVDELLKFDEISLNVTYKIGLVYCRAGQKTEEEMYNNDVGSPAFDEFMECIGEKVVLKGWDAFRAGLDNKSDTTGTHSLYTRYNNCQIMFHVSTYLPYTENDRQQVVRKRHIGNDIVTIIFQEEDSEPFTPAHFRSHYQHVFIVVRVASNPTRYQVAVTRSEEVPVFGPFIPDHFMKKGATFRHFILTKLINAENASLKAKKLALMARRTREQLLNNFSDTLCTTTTLVPNPGKRGNPGKIGRSWSFKRKGRFAQRLAPELVSRGALKWHVSLVEEGVEIPCYLAISPQQIVILDCKTRDMKYMLPCKAVLGWTSQLDILKLYYDTGEVVVMRKDTSSAEDDTTTDIDDIVKRLTCVSDGCETQEITVIKNQLGKLGFHIQFGGIVGDVTENGPAWASGLRPSSRLLEVRGVLVAELEHEQLISQLKGRDSLAVVAIPPFPDGQPRRSISQLQSPGELRSKSVSTSRHSLERGESRDTIAPLVERRITPEQKVDMSRAMTRGSMIALNLLEQELGIDDSEKLDLDEFLESIVGSEIRELEEEVRGQVKSLEALSDSRPATPPAPAPTTTDTGKRYALGSDPLTSEQPISLGKRYALGSDTLEFSNRRSVIGAERLQNGYTSDSPGTDQRPDINEIFRIIDRTRVESESNSRSPSDDISEIDAVVSMIEKVLENTDSYLREESRSAMASGASSTVDVRTDSRESSRDVTTPVRPVIGSATPVRPVIGSSTQTRPLIGRPNGTRVENIQRKMADYDKDMSLAIEQLDSINLHDSRRASISSSSLLSDEGFLPVVDNTSDCVNVVTESEQSTSDEDFPQRHYTMRMMRREGLLMEAPTSEGGSGRASFDNPSSGDIPPSPLQMLMERAREAQLDNSNQSDNSWVRTTLLRIAELEAALERSNFELQALRKQNREMEQTLEIVDEENAKIRREMERTNNQLSTFTTWVQSKQLL